MRLENICSYKTVCKPIRPFAGVPWDDCIECYFRFGKRANSLRSGELDLEDAPTDAAADSRDTILEVED